MTCHECGSNVAEIDVFCPFCGISLEPVSLAENETDDSMASTIMIQPSEIDALANAAKTTSPPVGASAGELEPEGVVAGKTDSAARAADEVSLDDIPTPLILGDVGKTFDNPAATSTSEFNFGEEAADHASETEGQTPALIDSQEETVSSADAGEPIFQQAAVASGEVEVGITADELDQNPLISTPTGDTGAVPEVDPIFLSGQSNSQSPMISNPGQDKEVTEKPAPDPDERRGQKDDLFEARLPAKFEGIAKPSEELESTDSYPSPSTFDSVRIMENRSPSQPDDVDTRIQVGDVRSSEPPAETNSAEAFRVSKRSEFVYRS